MKSVVQEERPRSPGIRGSRAPDYDPSKVQHIGRLLRGPNGSAQEVSEALASLTDAELTSFGLKAFQINMLSILGNLRPLQEIRGLARAAAITKLWLGWEYFYDYLPRLPAGDSEPHLRNLPTALLERLLAAGRGLVIATFHQGHFRHLASDLAITGFSVCMPLAGDAFQEFTTATKALSRSVFRTSIMANVTAVNVEELRGSLELAKALYRGDCICATIDGNTGLDGTRGNVHRAQVDVLGCRARAKIGLIRMAALRGTPILPLFAHTVDGERTCQVGPVIDAGGPLPADQAERFAEQAIRRLYALFGESLLSFPEQWSGCDHFHLWRVPDTPEGGRGSHGDRLRRDLEAGGRAIVNTRRIVDLSRDDDFVWVDVKTLQCYRLAAEMRELGARLCTPPGVDLAWLRRYEGARQSRMWALLHQLAVRGAIRSHGAEAAARSSSG